MDVVVLIARVAFVVVFVFSGVGHLTKASTMSGYAASRGLPMPKAAVVISGLLLVVGALSLLLGAWGDLGALILAVTVFSIAVLMHPFWKESDAQAKMVEQTQFNKDLSLAGGALAMFALFALVPDLGITLTDPLFDV